MSAASNTVRVGVGVCIINSEGKVLVGTRQGGHGAGTYSFPGGHLEFGESFQECGQREAKEETNLDVYDVRFLTTTNDVFAADSKHYVTIFVTCRVREGEEPENMEPHKCDGWEWVTWEYLRGVFQEHNDAEQNGRMDTFAGHILFLPVLDLFRQHPECEEIILRLSSQPQ